MEHGRERDLIKLLAGGEDSLPITKAGLLIFLWIYFRKESLGLKYGEVLKTTSRDLGDAIKIHNHTSLRDGLDSLASRSLITYDIQKQGRMGGLSIEVLF